MIRSDTWFAILGSLQNCHGETFIASAWHYYKTAVANKVFQFFSMQISHEIDIFRNLYTCSTALCSGKAKRYFRMPACHFYQQIKSLFYGA